MTSGNFITYSEKRLESIYKFLNAFFAQAQFFKFTR